MTRKIAIVGSKSLQGIDYVYKIIDDIVVREKEGSGSFLLINGGEEGVDTMAGEIALSRSIAYETIPLKACTEGCSSIGKDGQQFCFAHSYEPRSEEIAKEAQTVYRIYDEGCSTSTCEVTAKFGDELGKNVVKIPIDLLSVTR